MLQKLLDDHEHMKKALDLLEKQHAMMMEGGHPDPGPMLSIIVYLQEYSEQVHHPLEDAIFSVLLKRNGKTGKLAKELLVDHTRLETITRRLRSAFEETEGEQYSAQEVLVQDIPVLLERLRHHIKIEEEDVFPMVEHILTWKDWECIRSMVPDTEDPLFGKQVGNDYKMLYQALNIMD